MLLLNRKLYQIYRLIILFILIGCNKEETPENVIFKFGDEEGAVINHIDIFLQAPKTGGYNQHQYNLDVDQDGTYDFHFYSVSDTIDFPFCQVVNSVYGSCYDSGFEIVEVQNSGAIYETITETDDYYGTYPRKTFKHEFSCTNTSGSVINQNNYASYNVPVAFKSGDYLTDEGILYFTDDPYFRLTYNPIEEASFDFTIGGDSIVWHHYIYPEMCRSINHNEIFYLGFKKSHGTLVNYGWIEMKLSDGNRLDIYRTAIYN